MNRLFEIAALALGGISLFTVSFVAFAALSGVPMHEVAVIGKLVPAPAPPPVHEEPAPAPVAEPRPAEAVLASNLGILSAWKLEPPFSESELRALVDEIKLKTVQLEQRLQDLAAREAAVAERETAVAEQFETLDELRAKLEAFEHDLLLRDEEVARDEARAAEAEERRWASLARLFAEQDAEEAGRRLSAYSPADAAKILLHLEETVAFEILNTFTGDRFIEYAEAYAAATAEQKAAPRGDQGSARSGR